LKFPTLPALLGLTLAGLLIGCDGARPRAAEPAAPSVTVTVADPVHVTRTGTCYHQAGCRYLGASDFVESRADALMQGLTPCSACEQPLRVPPVYVTPTGKKFHKAGCQYLGKGGTPETRDKAVHDGLQPCSACGA